jgi:hypothetical protein
MTKLIWELLKDSYMPTPTEENWKLIAQRFYSLWNLPNCLGALDGKHIRIEKLPGSGSSNFNYKMYHSIVLFACSDADGFFTTIETGYAGRNSDGGILTQSRCGAGTTSTPLSRSRVRFLPSLNPGNDNTVSDITYLGKPGRGGKSYRNRWQRTDRSPQVTNLLLVTVVEVFIRSLFVFHYRHQKTINVIRHIIIRTFKQI